MSDIEIAPVHRRLDDRIRAHALIRILALDHYRLMRMRLKAGGISASPCRSLENPSKIRRLEGRIGGRVIIALSRTEKDQREPLDALNLPKPIRKGRSPGCGVKNAFLALMESIAKPI